MVSKFISPTKENTKSGKNKYKKDALEPVDYEFEFKVDPKFKTELCKTFSDTGFCAYGNKCRFAHGKDELFDRMASHPKYRKSDCLTFHTEGFCNYGPRCHFRHNESISYDKVTRSYFYWKLQAAPVSNSHNYKRLPIFEACTKTQKMQVPHSDSKFELTNQNYQKNLIFYTGYINHLKRQIDINLLKSNSFLPARASQNSHSAFAPRSMLFSDRKSNGSVYSTSPLSVSPVSPEDSIMSSKNVSRKLNFNELNVEFSL